MLKDSSGKLLQFTFCSMVSWHWRWGESGDYIFRCNDHDWLLQWTMRTNNGQPWKKAKLLETTNHVVAALELQLRLGHREYVSSKKARLSWILRASAIAIICHMLLVSDWDHCKSISQTWEITVTAALPFFAHWPYLSAVYSNRVTSRNDCKTFERNHRGITSEDKHSLFSTFPCSVFPTKSGDPLRGCNVRTWTPTTGSSLLLICAVPVATTSQQQLRCFHPRQCARSLLRKQLPSATTKGAAGTAHGHSNDMCSGSSGKTTTLPALYMYLSGRQESRTKVWATALLPKSDHSMEWDWTFLPEEEGRWHELQWQPPGGEGELCTKMSGRRACVPMQLW